MILRVIIVDDEPIAIRRLKQLLSRVEGVDVVGNAASATAVLDLVARVSPDLVLLDIEMPTRNGIELAVELGALDCPPSIVFTTAFAGFALAAFRVAADDYLLKPVELDDLSAAVERVRRRRSEQRGAERAGDLEDIVARLRGSELPDGGRCQNLWISGVQGRSRVALEEVSWIEAERDYVRMHAADRSYFVRGRIGQLAEQLSSHGFVRVHRSSLVRTSCVERIESIGDRAYRLTLSNGAVVASSRGFAAAVRRVWRDAN